jgi:hypothetical protein
MAEYQTQVLWGGKMMTAEEARLLMCVAEDDPLDGNGDRTKHRCLAPNCPNWSHGGERGRCAWEPRTRPGASALLGRRDSPQLPQL